MTETHVPLTHSEIRNHIQTATEEVFSTMLGLEITAGEMSLGHSSSHAGVTALLGLTGAWTGSGQISCEPPLACRIASRFLMAEYAAVDDDVLDALAELANMIIGNVKTLLEDKLGPMGLSTPVIISGGEFETRILGCPAWIVMPFACADGTLVVQVVLSPSKQQFNRARPAQAALAEAPEMALAG
jgi:chemotaxis protein CheX